MTAESLFACALDLPPEERAAFLATACPDDESLRQRVAALLAVHDPVDGFLEPAAARNGPTSAYIPSSLASELLGNATEKPGSRIGSYRLLEQIGEGGFGVVYMAEQQLPVRRKVALKIVKPGMDTRQVVARFEAERQALALMDHPNIAHVFDGGETESGRPYFVMELVRGMPITEFCDQEHVPIRGRLELFINVCQAVQHAHQKGIIHRDLKPSNILITLHDGMPVVKVIDFGIAKATGQQLTDKTLFTNFAQFIGTPMYMSPEQAALSGLDVDTRSDIYALGVLLYELLAGTTPFDKEKMRTAAYDEIRRIIREEEPQRPSTRLTTFGHDTSVVCVNRGSDAKQLSQLLRGELDWIVLKAIEKDRNRRYDSPGAFLADVQRYLRDEPVHACPPKLAYRLQKIMRRHKGPMLAGTILVLAMVGGIIGTTWGMVRARNAQADAVSESQQKEKALEEKGAALVAAQASEQIATDQLFQSLLNQARAELTSNRIGQRFNTLRAVRQAARIRVTPELRNQAAAALVLPDVEMLCEWNSATSGFYGRAFDASLQKYASLDKEGGLTICRLKDGREEVMARLPAHGTPIFRGLLMSQDGRFVAYGHGGASEGQPVAVRVWNLDGPEPKVLLDDTDGCCELAMAFHPDNRKLALGRADGFISIYDLATGRRLRRLRVGFVPYQLAFHPRDGRLAVAGSNAVRIFDTDTGQENPALHYESQTNVTVHVCWHPDGRHLAASGSDLKIHIWDVDAARSVMPAWSGHTNLGMCTGFNQSGDRCISADWSGTRRFWDTANGHQLLTLPDSFATQFGLDDSLIEFDANGTTLRKWRVASGCESRILRLNGVEGSDAIFHPKVHIQDRIVAASTPNCLNCYDLNTGEELASVGMPRRDAARAVGFSSSGGLFTGGFAGLLHWPARMDAIRSNLIHIGPPVELALSLGTGHSTGTGVSKDDQVFAVPDGNNGAILLDRRRPQDRRILGPQYDVRNAVVSHDGRLVVTCSHWHDGHSKNVRVWDAQTGQQIHELPLEGATVATFSPDDRWLATSGWGGSQLWDVATWKEVRRGNRGIAAFSPDSRLMALGDTAGVVRLVETASGSEVARLTGPDSSSYLPMAFSSDGAILIAIRSDLTAFCTFNLRLIREQLKGLSLDWDWPELPPANPTPTTPLQLAFHMGDLAQAGPTNEKMAHRAIQQYRAALETNPDSALDCNNLAWMLVAGPVAVRDAKAAVSMAEKAVQLAPTNAMYVNTLGVAYYRDGQFRKAIDTLRPNLERQDDASLAFDLIFIAMAHHQLGETDRARDYFDWVSRWTRTQREVSLQHQSELRAFRMEAEELLQTGGPSPKND